MTGGAGVKQTAIEATATLACDTGYTMYNTATSTIVAANTFTFTCIAAAAWDTNPSTLQCQQGGYLFYGNTSFLT